MRSIPRWLLICLSAFIIALIVGLIVGVSGFIVNHDHSLSVSPRNVTVAPTVTRAKEASIPYTAQDTKRIEDALSSANPNTQTSVLMSDLRTILLQHPDALPQGAQWHIMSETLQVKGSSGYVEAVAEAGGAKSRFIIYLDFSSSWLISGITKK